MIINFDKRIVKEIIYSGVFLISLIVLIVVLLIKDVNLAVLIVLAPIILYFSINSVKYILRTINKINGKSTFIECSSEKVKIYSINGDITNIESSDIKYIACDADKLYIRLKSDKKLRKKSFLQTFFSYYTEKNDDLILYTMWCEMHEINKLCDYIGVEYRESSETNIDVYVNLCSRHFLILVGACIFIIWICISCQSFKLSIISFCICIIILVVMNKNNKASLCEDNVSMGLILRCVMTSFFIAQYIVIACKIEEILKNCVLLEPASINSGIVSLVVYIIFGCLYISPKGIGSKLIYIMANKRIGASKTQNRD